MQDRRREATRRQQGQQVQQPDRPTAPTADDAEASRPWPAERRGDAGSRNSSPVNSSSMRSGTVKPRVLRAGRTRRPGVAAAVVAAGAAAGCGVGAAATEVGTEAAPDADEDAERKAEPEPDEDAEPSEEAEPVDLPEDSLFLAAWRARRRDGRAKTSPSSSSSPPSEAARGPTDTSTRDGLRERGRTGSPRLLEGERPRVSGLVVTGAA
jgi:hypothetical protein